MKNIIFFIFVTLILTACSNKQLYQAGQGHQKNKCIKESGSKPQYNDCLNADRKSFEEYEEDRKALEKNEIKITNSLVGH